MVTQADWAQTNTGYVDREPWKGVPVFKPFLTVDATALCGCRCFLKYLAWYCVAVFSNGTSFESSASAILDPAVFQVFCVSEQLCEDGDAAKWQADFVSSH